MKLKAWREAEGLTQAALARRLTELSLTVTGSRREIPQQTVHALEAGRVPRKWLGRLVHAASAGAVTPNDSYDLPVLREAQDEAAP